MTLKITILFFFLASICQPVAAQYRGGSNDGFVSGLFNQENALPVIYRGGQDDGYRLLTTGTNNFLPQIYSGGFNDGVSIAFSPGQNSLPGIYAGGNNDGYALAPVSAMHGLPNIYSGGNNDGYVLSSVTGSNQYINIYAGGSNDGWALVSVNNQNPFSTLPVNLLMFSGRWDNGNARLTWQTASEINNDHFDIERSDDRGLSFQRVGTVRGSGTTTTGSNYQFDDVTAAALPVTVLMYRLRVVDISGRFSYSAIIQLKKNSSPYTYLVFPNPGTGLFNLAIKEYTGQEEFSIRIYNQTGTIVYSGQVISSDTKIDISCLPAGAYWLQVSENLRQQAIIKIILTR